jgi:transketolase
LAGSGVGVRLVSVPSWELFREQDAAYRESVLLPTITARLAVEAGASQGWDRLVGDSGGILSIDHFGASAPGPVLFEKFGFTVENVVRLARELLAK